MAGTVISECIRYFLVFSNSARRLFKNFMKYFTLLEKLIFSFFLLTLAILLKLRNLNYT